MKMAEAVKLRWAFMRLAESAEHVLEVREMVPDLEAGEGVPDLDLALGALYDAQGEIAGRLGTQVEYLEEELGLT